MKKSEMVILSNLRHNARESLTRMGRRTSIPISTIYEKMKQYEKDIIKKYTIIMDFGKLGFNTKVMMLVKTKKEDRDNLRGFLVENKHVNSIHKINNEYDFMIEGIFRELKDVEDFLERLEVDFGVVDKQIYYMVDEIKKEGFMSNAETFNYTEN